MRASHLTRSPRGGRHRPHRNLPLPNRRHKADEESGEEIVLDRVGVCVIARERVGGEFNDRIRDACTSLMRARCKQRRGAGPGVAVAGHGAGVRVSGAPGDLR